MISSKYILEPELHKKIQLKERLEKHGIQECFDDIYPWLDCTKIINDKGWRKNQTINIYYRIELGEILYMLSIYGGADKEKYLQMIEERHNKNIEFEKTNPPLTFDENDARKTKKRKSKEVDSNAIIEKRREKVNKIKKGFKFLVDGPIV